MSRFTEPLTVSPLGDGRRWRILRPFEYFVGYEDSQEFVDVRIGFVTDFASIPRFLWWLLPQWGIYGNAAVIHDYLYSTGQVCCDAGILGLNDFPVTRKEADDIFLEAMEVLNTPRWQKYIIYAGVRIGGWLPWRRYRK